MTFVQVIDCKTHQIDALNKVMDSWVEATKGKRTATHAMMGRDRSDSTHLMEIVEFPSYEAAMANSQLPETDRIFREMVALCDEAPSFTDLDVLRDEQLNKNVVRDFFEEVVNKGDIDAMDGMCTADYREHDPSQATYDASLAEVKVSNREIMEGFHPTATVESLMADGDLVCARFSFKGRHVAPYQGLEATNRDVAGTGHATFRCKGGKMAESWWNVDDLGLMQQLGVVES
ncbi:ester cyclase [Streptomyces sp. NPDC059037]|uniref:ester cyclase n=1 Tax=Streptomyces sp. NPDC059037 TaxID=3346710 RepID=UPI0036C49571